MYRTCEDCMWNDADSNCKLGNNEIFENHYDQNCCEDGTGNIFIEEGDNIGDDEE